ncbi:hypothetical protein BG011_006887 [Mortierella polycephala]|uniref:Uncharacterized protein n=1 Tax=Mortierella polycephala TaxID=41804 RepID=A0A9P6QAQ1_9FUNG|nr:hypothetical protein BG011_006887 [Mortierella polycephala]
MNQVIQGALPILSNILGNSTVAGFLAIFNMALDTVTTTTTNFNQNYDQYAKHQSSSFHDQAYDQYAFEGQGQDHENGSRFQSVVMSTFAMVFSTINSAFAFLTASNTPLTTYIILALLSYVAFLIVYGFVSWVVRSVLNLIKMSIIVAAVTTILWFIINITSSTEGQDAGSRHQDPISQVLGNLQTKFRAEYQRQQQHLQNPHAL